MKGCFHNFDFVSTFKDHTETEYEHSKKQKDPISFSSSTTSNELVEDDEESNNINCNIMDASAFQNYENISTKCHSNKYGEVNLHPEDFHYLTCQHDRMNGDNTPIFNSKSLGGNFLAKSSPHVQRREINWRSLWIIP